MDPSPPHRTDCGAFLLAENIGARSLIFLKDKRGLFEKDPKKVPELERDQLEFFDRISAAELLERDLDDLIIERPIIQLTAVTAGQVSEGVSDHRCAKSPRAYYGCA
jgi:uridylate kinase